MGHDMTLRPAPTLVAVICSSALRSAVDQRPPAAQTSTPITSPPNRERAALDIRSRQSSRASPGIDARTRRLANKMPGLGAAAPGARTCGHRGCSATGWVLPARPAGRWRAPPRFETAQHRDRQRAGAGRWSGVAARAASSGKGEVDPLLNTVSQLASQAIQSGALSNLVGEPRSPARRRRRGRRARPLACLLACLRGC
jgi:hypothetical protein